MITNTPVLALATWSIVLIVILVVLVAALIGLYFFGRNAEKNRLNSRKLWKLTLRQSMLL